MGCFFCRNISSIYSKRFWGNFRIIPQIYKCQSFTQPFKFINQLWILNKFFIKFSSNLLNTEHFIILCTDRILIGIMFKHGITQGGTINGCPLIGWSCVGSYVAIIFFLCVNINTGKKLKLLSATLSNSAGDWPILSLEIVWILQMNSILFGKSYNLWMESSVIR